MKFVLIILDGVGLRDERDANALRLAHTPVLDDLLTNYPCARIETSGAAVGLPNGVMGNSEVGHITLGAGRIVEHDLVRINRAIANGQFGNIPALNDLLDYVLDEEATLHLIGLLSDGGVHSHIRHLFRIIRLARKRGLKKVFVHAITDGRDTSPSSGIEYLRQTIEAMERIGVGQISTIMGRYYAMDRDNRWERTKIAYDAIMKGVGKKRHDPLAAVRESYRDEITDEFIKPIVIRGGNGKTHPVSRRDGALMFNFRADRMRQIVQAIADPQFQQFSRDGATVRCTTMTSYDDTFRFPVLFQPVSLQNIFPEVLDREGFRQLRIAETEKYAHVTYFFNGGEESPFSQEDRLLIPSPRVATYDLQPEMSAPEVTKKVLDAIHSEDYDCIIMNFANPDMVGHTGDIDAAIRSVETIDKALGRIIPAARKKGGAVFVTSDHGNLEMMVDPGSGEVHTAHTLNAVPFIMVTSNDHLSLEAEGGLADIAPTILTYLGIPLPKEMTGKNLLIGR